MLLSSGCVCSVRRMASGGRVHGVRGAVAAQNPPHASRRSFILLTMASCWWQFEHDRGVESASPATGDRPPARMVFRAADAVNDALSK